MLVIHTPVNRRGFRHSVAKKIANFSLRFKNEDVKISLVYSGGLAQLGERLHGMQEVTGSSPVSSTIFLPTTFVLPIFL